MMLHADPFVRLVVGVACLVMIGFLAGYGWAVLRMHRRDRALGRKVRLAAAGADLAARGAFECRCGHNIGLHDIDTKKKCWSPCKIELCDCESFDAVYQGHGS